MKLFKKKSKKVLIFFLLDRSGSMQSIKDATVEGVNGFLNSQKKTKDCMVTLNLFDGLAGVEIQRIYSNIPIGDVPPMKPEEFVPRGSTPLYDAIQRTIAEADSIPGKERVLFVIMTDGEENSSRETTNEKVFDLIGQKSKEGWEFVYLGANQDAYHVGKVLNIPAGNTLNYDSTQSGTRAAFSTMTSSAQVYNSDPDKYDSGNFFKSTQDSE